MTDSKTLIDPSGDTLIVQRDPDGIVLGVREGEAGWSLVGPCKPAVLHAAIDEVTGETHGVDYHAASRYWMSRALVAEGREATPTVVHDGGAYWKGEYERVVQERDEAVDRAKKAGREARFWKDHAEEVGDSAAYMKQMWKKAEAERDEALAETEGAPMTAREHLDAAQDARASGHPLPKGATIPAGVPFWVKAGEEPWEFVPGGPDGDFDTSPFPSAQYVLVDPPTPTRPDGAETIEAYMREIVASHPEDHYGELADHLASRGVLPPLTDKSEPRRGVRVEGGAS